MRDHPRPEFHQRALGERRGAGPEAPQDQLPPLVDLRRDDRFRIADLIVGLQQRHHRQQRRRQRRHPARLIGGRQLRLERLVEELGADLAQEHVELANAVELVRHAAARRRSASSGPASESVWACAHQITSRSPSRSPPRPRTTVT